jgi:hypothetical protein
MHRKFEELNRVYADLVRRYREIERERDQVNLEIEDTRRRYRAIEEEYAGMAAKIEKMSISYHALMPVSRRDFNPSKPFWMMYSLASLTTCRPCSMRDSIKQAVNCGRNLGIGH